MTNSNLPAYHAYTVSEPEGEGKATWTRIGAAWAHKNGDGLNLHLDCLPIDGRVVLRKPKPKSDDRS
jgi:hypothetical protein